MDVPHKARTTGLIVVGEVKLRLEDRKKKRGKEDVFDELEDNVGAMQEEVWRSRDSE